MFSDRHEWKESDIASYLRPFFNDGAFHAPPGKLGAGMKIVSDNNSGSEKNIVLDTGILSHITTGMDLDAVANFTAIVNYRMRPYGKVISNFIFFPDDNIMSCFKMVTDFGSRVRSEE